MCIHAAGAVLPFPMRLFCAYLLTYKTRCSVCLPSMGIPLALDISQPSFLLPSLRKGLGRCDIWVRGRKAHYSGELRGSGTRVARLLSGNSISPLVPRTINVALVYLLRGASPKAERGEMLSTLHIGHRAARAFSRRAPRHCARAARGTLPGRLSATLCLCISSYLILSTFGGGRLAISRCPRYISVLTTNANRCSRWRNASTLYHRSILWLRLSRSELDSLPVYMLKGDSLCQGMCFKHDMEGCWRAVCPPTQPVVISDPSAEKLGR